MPVCIVTLVHCVKLKSVPDEARPVNPYAVAITVFSYQLLFANKKLYVVSVLYDTCTRKRVIWALFLLS